MGTSRRNFLKTTGFSAMAAMSLGLTRCSSQTSTKPNIIIIFTDDMGYGDAGCFGHPTISTPNLDRMAAEGTKLTQFYCSSPVCSPSRASLLTGRLPQRTGVTGVLWPESKNGLNQDEILIPALLKKQGYATACFGKWHLGHKPGHLPTDKGFDSYFGIPYSNDMFIGSDDPISENAVFNKGYTREKTRADQQLVAELGGNFNKVFQTHLKHKVPLYDKDEIVEYPANQHTLTRRYTERTENFISEHKNEPFFIYLAHSYPHVPLHASDEFKDKSRRGLYGDVMEEIDWSVGRILQKLKSENLHKNTLVIFTSDNGPWLQYGTQGGSNGILQGGKFSTWEGGMRVPCLAWWPGKIPAGCVNMEMTSTLDLLPTIAALAGQNIPDNKVLDGYDIRSTLFDKATSPRETMFFYAHNDLKAVRFGPWKVHYEILPKDAGYGAFIKPEHPLLFNLEHDPGEQYDVSKQHPEIIQRIQEIVAKHRAGFKKDK